MSDDTDDVSDIRILGAGFRFVRRIKSMFGLGGPYPVEPGDPGPLVCNTCGEPIPDGEEAWQRATYEPTDDGAIMRQSWVWHPGCDEPWEVES